MREIIIATFNKDKFKEVKEILRPLSVRLIPLYELKFPISIKEDGESFFSNALKKATVVYKYTKKPCIGEDSGLVVFSLGGLPGVHSARFSKERTSLSNNMKLLNLLKGKPWSKRKAEFICSVVYVDTQKICYFEGRIKGYIDYKLKGKHGFGYDPLFFIPSYKKTFAQLPLSVKNKISHRAKAFKKLKLFLKKEMCYNF
ncbi:MAG: non-canonical purine NTP pyrophosphatase, RdgB/HAM1 family [Candidatus Omnitrophica bacterium 4484_70.2]|nr:MAG: non-canonical purine NTP pyrophosphatase, RdgB/HAM1 family [Candidatus Omnitrophica bacterium 4484_70.2]